MHKATVAAICAVGALLTPPAFANPTIRATLEAELALENTPNCSLCHEGTPSNGTATTPFAAAMKARGLVSSDASSVARAIDAMISDGVDSDGDGELDIDELKAGKDPNVEAGLLTTSEEPKTGCGASVAGRDVSHAGAGAAGLTVLLLAAGWIRSRWERKGVGLRAP